MPYYARKVYEDQPAGSSVFSIDFKYTNPSEVKVEINRELVAFTFTSSSVITLTNPLDSPATVQIYRTTDLTERTVDFQNVANLTENDLDKSALQVFNATQEAVDNTTAAEGTLTDLLAQTKEASDDSKASAELSYKYERLASQHSEDAFDYQASSLTSKDLAGTYAKQAQVSSSAAGNAEQNAEQSLAAVNTAKNEALASHVAFNEKVTNANTVIESAQSIAITSLEASTAARAVADAAVVTTDLVNERVGLIEGQTAEALTLVMDAKTANTNALETRDVVLAQVAIATTAAETVTSAQSAINSTIDTATLEMNTIVTDASSNINTIKTNAISEVTIAKSDISTIRDEAVTEANSAITQVNAAVAQMIDNELYLLTGVFNE